MAQNLAGFYKQNAGPPLLTTVGAGLRTGADTATDIAQAAEAKRRAALAVTGVVADSAPKVLGVPMAGIANFMQNAKNQLQAGYNGTSVPATVSPFTALSGTQLLGLGNANAAPVSAAGIPSTLPASAPIAAPAALPPLRSNTSYTQGAGLPSDTQIASDKVRASTAQAASDAAMGISSTPAVAPANINVARQANGILGFSGSGGNATGGVVYTGLPKWTSQGGGAGQGSVDVGGESFRPAQQAIVSGQGWNAGSTPLALAQKYAAAIAAGEGGPVGVANNHMALQALAPMLTQTMLGQTQLGVAGLGAQTQRYAADLGERENAARVGMGYGEQETQKQIEAERAAAGINQAQIRGQYMSRAGQTRLASAQAEQQERINALTHLYTSGTNPDGTKATPAQRANYIEQARQLSQLRTGTNLGTVEGMQALSQAAQTGGMPNPNDY